MDKEIKKGLVYPNQIMFQCNSKKLAFEFSKLELRRI